ncbi:hypothetical protein HYW42_04260 [Candidatus Daviesbacteria bacterium]|nr:hypothetical protein [Candidatus Daviesbacteria bacterium]
MFDNLRDSFSKKNLINLLLLGILVLAVPLSVDLVRRQQVFKSFALGESIELLSNKCVKTRDGKQVVVCPEISFKITPPREFLASNNSLSKSLALNQSILGTVYAGHPEGTEGWYCADNQIWHDKADGNHEFWEDCGSDKECVSISPPPGYSQDAECRIRQQEPEQQESQPREPQCEWRDLRNECTACNEARKIEKKVCDGNDTGETRIAQEGVSDSGCSSWCSNQPEQEQQPSGGTGPQWCSGYVQDCWEDVNGDGIEERGTQWCSGGVNEGGNCAWDPQVTTCGVCEIIDTSSGQTYSPGGQSQQQCNGDVTVDTLAPTGVDYLVSEKIVTNEKDGTRYKAYTTEDKRNNKTCGYEYFQYISTLSDGKYCANYVFGPWDNQQVCKDVAVPPAPDSSGCTTGSAGSITQQQAECVIGKRSDLLSFFRNNGWCTDKKENYQGIVNNWMGINTQNDKDQVASCLGSTPSSCTTGSAGTVTLEQAKCVLGKRSDILTFYRSNSWCTDKEDNYPGIINNWMGINNQNDKNQVASCFSQPSSTCSIKLQRSGTSGWSQALTVKVNDRVKIAALNSLDQAIPGVNLSVSGPNNFSRSLSNQQELTLSTQGTYSITARGGSCDSASAATLTVSPSDQSDTQIEFRIAEERADLSKQNFIKIPAGRQHEVINHTLANTTPGKKFMWVEFKKGDQFSSPISAEIEYVGPAPQIDTLSCNLDIAGKGLVFEIEGNNFSANQGRLTANNTQVTITEWIHNKIKGNIENPSFSPTAGQSYQVVVTRNDGESFQQNCLIGISQIILGVKPVCVAPNRNIANVEVAIKEASASGNAVRETVEIDKEGVIKNLKTKLQGPTDGKPGKRYKISVKAPQYLRRHGLFTAASGTTVLPGLSLPWGDICPTSGDGIINSIDKSCLNQQWGKVASTAKVCDCNGDGVCNAFEWGYMKLNFNDVNDAEL